MGLLGFLSGKKTVTIDTRNELRKHLDHLDTVLNKLNTTDSISAYFKSFEDMLLTYHKLEVLEDTYDWKHGKYTWKGGVRDALQGIEDTRPKAEVKFVDRAYEKLQRDCLKLSTDKAKERKREQFFSELEHYYEYLEDSTIEYIQSLK